MRIVNTVLGPISPDRLGPTLMHEHIAFGIPGWYGDVTLGRIKRDEMVRAGTAMMEELRTFGVQTYVDATANDLGRDAELLRLIAENTEINIICATGYFSESLGAPAYFKSRRGIVDVESEVYEMLVAEITEGIADTGIKAGVIKLASSKGTITKYEQMLFRAAARAQQQTGMPIITHTDGGTMGPEQAELLLAAGADPKRVVIGHMCCNTDLRYHLRTLAQGVYVGFDRMGLSGNFGMFDFPLDVERYPVILGLIAAGYASQLTLSTDFNLFQLGRPRPGIHAMAPQAANHHSTHLFKRVIPKLKEAGVSDAQIETIMVDNPRRLFGGE